MEQKKRRFDDRQSLERARHELQSFVGWLVFLFFAFRMHKVVINSKTVTIVKMSAALEQKKEIERLLALCAKPEQWCALHVQSIPKQKYSIQIVGLLNQIWPDSCRPQEFLELMLKVKAFAAADLNSLEPRSA